MLSYRAGRHIAMMQRTFAHNNEPPEWPNEMYVGTPGGVYHTTDFTGTDDPTQPTWALLDDGLPGTYTLRRVFVDPFAPADYQYCVLDDVDDGAGGTTSKVYRRSSGGNWTEILSVASLAAVTGEGVDALYFAVDRAVEGRLVVLSYKQFGNSRCVRSSDRGENWTMISTSPIPDTNYGFGSTVIALGDVVYYRRCHALYWDSIAKSIDGGATFIYSRAGEYPRFAGLAASPDLPLRLYVTEGGDLNLEDVDAETLTPVQDDLDLGTYFGWLWLSDTDAAWQRVMRNYQIIETRDAWSTAAVLSDALPKVTYQQLVPLDLIGRDWNLLGFDSPTAIDPHTIYALNISGAPNAPLGKSGNSPDVAPYTDSIPYTAGGIVRGGIQIVT